LQSFPVGSVIEQIAIERFGDESQGGATSTNLVRSAEDRRISGEFGCRGEFCEKVATPTSQAPK
jgi:hypothetical protein